MRNSLLLVLCLLGAVYAHTQAAREFYKHYGADDGLSGNTCNKLLEDHNGFLWIGSSEGLDRYDGHRFEHFIHIPGDSNSICGNTIRALAEDAQGNIWIGTYGEGITRYNPSNRSYKHYKFKAGRFDQTRDNRIMDLVALSDGNIFAATDLGLYVLSPGSDKFKPAEEIYSFKPSLVAGTSGLAYDRINNLLWIYNLNSLFLLDVRLGKLYSKEYNPNAWKLLQDSPTIQPVTDREGKVWYFRPASNSLVSADLSSGLSEEFFLPPSHREHAPNSIHYNALTHSIVLSYWNAPGLNYFISEKNFDNSAFTQTYPGCLGSVMILDAHHAQNGIQWYATNKGLYAMAPDRSASMLYWFPDGENILDLAVVHDTVYIVSQKGMYLFAPDKTSPEYIIPAQADNPFTFLEYLSETNELFTATRTEILRVNRKTQRTSLFLSGTNSDYFSRKENAIQFLFCDSKKRYWIGTWGGNLTLAHDPLQKPLKHFSSLTDPDSWPGVGLLSIHEFNNEIFIGFNAGLGVWKFDESTLAFKPFITNETYSNLNGVIDDIEVNADGHFLLATHGGGIACIQPSTGKADFISRMNHLPGEYVYRIFPVNDSTYLLNTNNGMAMLTYPELNIKTLPNSFRQDFPLFTFSGEKDSQGRFWLYHKNYLRSFLPNASNYQSKSPQVTALFVNDREEALNTRDIRLDWNSGVLTIWFTSFPFLNENLIEYAYSLNNGSEWLNNGNLNFLRLTNLPHGEYTLLLRSRIASGKWSEIQSIRIEVMPPFWKTWWFITLAAILILALIVAIYRYRIHQILKVQRIRNSISSDLHDDIGATLSSIRIYSKLASDQLHSSPENSHKMLEKINDNATTVMENMSDIVWSINPGNDSLESLINRVKIHSIEVLQPLGIHLKLEINIPADLALNMRARKNIYLILKEAINNIAKHSKSDRAEVHFRIHGKELSILIQDNGKFSPNIGGKGGNGMRSMESRVHELHGSFSIAQNETGGLALKINLPITRISDSD